MLFGRSSGRLSDGRNDGDFLEFLLRYGLESIATVALDARLGCFKEGELDPEAK